MLPERLGVVPKMLPVFCGVVAVIGVPKIPIVGLFIGDGGGVYHDMDCGFEIWKGFRCAVVAGGLSQEGEGVLVFVVPNTPVLGCAPVFIPKRPPAAPPLAQLGFPKIPPVEKLFWPAVLPPKAFPKPKFVCMVGAGGRANGEGELGFVKIEPVFVKNGLGV